jgi:hypothetical protein
MDAGELVNVGGFAVLPAPPWERLCSCCDADSEHTNVAVDPAEETRPGPATGVWWHARRIADSVFIDLVDWTGGPHFLAYYILRLDGTVEFSRWADGVDPQELVGWRTTDPSCPQ